MSNDYCTIAQFRQRFDERLFDELSNDDDSSTADTTNFQAALDDAAGELEGFLANRYSLPLASVPAVLTRWVAVKAAAMLFGRRSDMPDKVRADIQWADDWIESLIARRVSLPEISRSSIPSLLSSEATDGTSRFDPGARNFDRGPSDTSTSKGE